MLDAEKLEKAKIVQMGLQQFDSLHIPEMVKDSVNEDREILICKECQEDYPCERMLLFMLLQSIASLSAMLPTGNMGALMNRFMGNGKQG